MNHAYIGPTGSKQWTTRVFQSTDTTAETSWEPAFVRREKDEVANPPADWEPDVTYIRRKVHLSEPMGMTDNPYVKVDVEKNTVEIDPEGGVPTTDNVIEVRADSVGKLEVGPIDIDAVLEDSRQVVSIEFMPEGRKHDGSERSVVKFQWEYDNQNEPRYWEIFTGQLDYVPRYNYRVSVFVKGSIFSAGRAWTGPWVEGQGNGPLMVRLPRPDDEGVQSRHMSPREIALDTPTSLSPVNQPPTEPTKPTGSEVAAPPASNGQPTSEVMLPPPGVGRTERTNGAQESHSVSGYSLSAPRMEAPPIEYGQDDAGTSTPPTSRSQLERSQPLEELTGDDAWVRL